MATFALEVLARLDKVREIEIETTRRSGEHRRTIVWIAIDGDDVYIRSEYGDAGWWYRNITERPSAVVHPRDGLGHPVAVTAIHTPDQESIERCSAAIRRKYRPGGSVNVMTMSPALEATLRLEPA